MATPLLGSSQSWESGPKEMSPKRSEKDLSTREQAKAGHKFLLSGKWGQEEHEIVPIPTWEAAKHATCHGP